MEINNELEVFHLLFLALNTNWAGYPIKVSPFGNRLPKLSFPTPCDQALFDVFGLKFGRGNWSVTN